MSEKVWRRESSPKPERIWLPSRRTTKRSASRPLREKEKRKADRFARSISFYSPIPLPLRLLPTTITLIQSCPAHCSPASPALSNPLPYHILPSSLTKSSPLPIASTTLGWNGYNNKENIVMSLVKANQTTDFPILEQQRKCTDLCCTIIGLSFTALLLILALILTNPNNEIKTSFPSDSKGRVCGFDLPQFPFIYFTNFPKIENRVCVSACPKKDDPALQCVPTDNIGCSFNSNPDFYVGFYPNQPQTTSIGSFCVPTSQAQKDKLYQEINVMQRFTFLHHINTILISCLIALTLSVFFVVLVQYMPRRMIKYTFGLGCLIIAVMTIFVLVFPSGHLLARIVFAIVLILLLVTIIIGWRRSGGTFRLYSEFCCHTTEMVGENKRLCAYILIFLAVLTLFLLMVAVQLRCLWSSARVEFDMRYVYYQFVTGQTTGWTVLVLIQTVWGLTFVKLAFNFCVSGNAVEWYYKAQANSNLRHSNSNLQDNSSLPIFLPLKQLFTCHFGSVVAGAFMQSWFAVPDYIFDCLRSDQPQNEDSACGKCVAMFDDFFDLVRSDAMGYIYLTGNPYCNSSRYCQYLCRKSPLTRNSQSISRAYRFCAHFLIAGTTSIINIFLQGSQTSVFIVLVVFILSLFLSTFFISLHADATQSIQIIFLMDEYFATKDMSNQIKNQFNDEVISKMKLKRKLAERIAKIFNEGEEEELN